MRTNFFVFMLLGSVRTVVFGDVLFYTDSGDLDCGKILYAIYPGGQELPTHRQYLIMSLINRGIDRTSGKGGLEAHLKGYKMKLRDRDLWKTHLIRLIEAGWVEQVGKNISARYRLSEKGKLMRDRAEQFFRRIYNEGQLRRGRSPRDEKLSAKYSGVPPPEIKQITLVLLNYFNREPLSRKDLSEKVLKKRGITYELQAKRTLLGVLAYMEKQGWIESSRTDGESPKFWITSSGERVRAQAMAFYFQSFHQKPPR